MDIFELILLCALAAVFYVCALLLCGGRISLIHSYQRKMSAKKTQVLTQSSTHWSCSLSAADCSPPVQ